MKVNSVTWRGLYPSSVSESPPRLIKFMLSVGATESAVIFEQFPSFLYNLTSFNATYSGKCRLLV